MTSSSSHLDERWDPVWRLVEAGDVVAALTRARELSDGTEDDQVEVLAVELELISQQQPDRVQEVLEEGARRLPNAVRPRLWLAEWALEAGDFDRAHAAALEVIKTARVGSNRIAEAEGELLVAYALYGLGNHERLADQLDAIEDASDGDAELHYRRAALLHSVGRLSAALRAAQAAVAKDNDHADAHYELARIAEHMGDSVAARHAFLRVHHLDSKSDHEPSALDPGDVEHIVVEALDALPAEVRDRLRGVAILVEPRPSLGDVEAGVDPRLLGLFDGTPYPVQGMGQPHSPDRVIIYHRCLEESCETVEELLDQIRITVWHETAHFFGLEEDEVHALGLG